jgi:hypothetical protein
MKERGCVYDGFQLKHLGLHDGIDELQRDFTRIHQCRKRNLLGIRKTKKKIALITVYRDNKTHERKKQMEEFVEKMNVLLQPYCQHYMYIVEQSDDGKGFNIGKTKNIGFDLAFKKKDGFDHFIFSDIDMIPDYDLIKYYVQSPKKGVVSLAVRGSRWSKKTIEEVFFGGVISMTKETFQKINGYPNQYWGWGGEDRDVILRCCQEKVMNYKPSRGDIIDIEEYDAKRINIPEKLKLVSRNKEGLIVEKQFFDIQHYKTNGWNSISYDILEITKRGENVEHVKVDLKYATDMKKHPDWFPKRYAEKNYSHAKNEILKKIQMYLSYSVPI